MASFDWTRSQLIIITDLGIMRGKCREFKSYFSKLKSLTGDFFVTGESEQTFVRVVYREFQRESDSRNHVGFPALVHGYTMSQFLNLASNVFMD